MLLKIHKKNARNENNFKLEQNNSFKFQRYLISL